MTRMAAVRTMLAGGALAVAGALAVGCTHNVSSSASGPASATATSAAQSPTAPSAARPATSPASASASSASTGQPASSAPAPVTSTTRVPMQRPAGGEFLSPSGNISCEVSLTSVYCQTGAPARSVTMSVTGRYTPCAGVTCLGNPGEDTPTLAYGTATGVGPFLCESATAGVTCTAGGRGFLISASGITSVAP
jgi:hypothetical protein